MAALSPLVDAIAAQGYAVVPRFLDSRAVTALRNRARALDDGGLFVPAGVGRRAGLARREDVRGDRICWLDDVDVAPAEVPLRNAVQALRAAVNRELQLGLVDFEAHYALYPPGARYARHRDRFRDDDARVLSIVVYLNDAWAPADGGALRLYVTERSAVDILPEGGTLVALLSERIDHEVLPAVRPRLSIAGWFRRRT